MAPIRTRSQAAAAPSGGIGKKVHRKARAVQKEPSDSWELLGRQGLNGNGHNDDMMETQDQDDELALTGPEDVDEAVSPLREMAEKVGREVETFAETMDQFFKDLPTIANRYDAAHDLVLEFKAIADAEIHDRKKEHDREMRDQLKREWSSKTNILAASTALEPFTTSELTERKAKQVRDLRLWQQEADIWELFRIMLELHPFEDEAAARRAEKEEKLAKLGPPHRYTSEGDLWERFLMENDLARERYLIKTWLEQTADHQGGDVQGIVEELETKAGRGKGLWSSGWLHTREKIKGEKRLRSWPNAEESPLPQIRRSDNNELLVTTLDPDAPHRQQRTLEKPDSYYERAFWVACWEMLRRGVSYQEICDWCEERKEGWRALCMGKGSDNSEAGSSAAAWRHICLLTSQSGCSTDYEAAVFALLGGDVKAVEKICRTIDDHLHAYYSATLTRQFDSYVLATCPDKATPATWRRGPVENSTTLDPDHAQRAISDLIARLRRNTSTSSEAAKPMKIIQSFLLADEVGSLVHTVGSAAAQDATGTDHPALFHIHNHQAPTVDKATDELGIVKDAQTLRIVAHMALIHRILSPDYLQGDELLQDENVLVAYIELLRQEGKRALVPTYAAQLRKDRYVVILGRLLEDVPKGQEQTNMLRCLQDLDLDLVAIFEQHLSWVLWTSLDNKPPKTPFQILEPSNDVQLHSGQSIKAGFLPDLVNADDEAIVTSLEWFKLLHGGWEVTFKALTLALKRCLLTGHFASARMIIKDFPYEKMSLHKSYETTGRAVNLFDNTTELISEDEGEAMAWELMRRQSRTYFELGQIVGAVEGFYHWRLQEFQYAAVRHEKKRGVPKELRVAKELLTESMRPILSGILLNPTDEQEAKDLAQIRQTYLPEIILAYNVVLYAAGSLISREAFLESMDMSAVIANDTPDAETSESGNSLADCFVKAGRMRELVESFALMSKQMLILKAQGRPWKPKKDREGRDLGIWEIGRAPAEVDVEEA